MRILHVLTSVDPAMGGVANSVVTRGIWLSEHGHKVHIASVDDPSADFIRGYPLQVFALGPRATSWAYSRRLLPWLLANVSNYDHVVIDGIWQFHGLAVRQACLERSVPYSVFVHGMLDPWFKRTYPLKHLKKAIFWAWSDYRVLRDASGVLFTCEEEAKLARQSFSLYKANEKIVPLGIHDLGADFPMTPPTLAAELSAARPYILFLGRLHEKKGCELLLRSYARFIQAQGPLAPKLMMVGPGEPAYVAHLRKMALELGVESKIIWRGMVKGLEKNAVISAAECFILPSHQENFGIAILEALAFGKPVLITNKINIFREISGGGAGYISNDDMEGVLGSLNRWFLSTDAEKKKMAKSARMLFEEKFLIDSAAERFVEAVAPG